MKNRTGRGVFIALEGIDGSGKSTQTALLAARLKGRGIPCRATMEPTGGPIGSLIRQVMTGRVNMDPKTVAALFAADRLDHLTNQVDGLLAKLAEGVSVVTDRYYFSSYAYQGVDAPLDWLIQANSQASALLRPDATIFIDVDPDQAMERILQNRSSVELFETKPRLVQAREAYLEAFRRLKEETVIFVDGNRPQEAVQEEIWDWVKGYFL